MSKQFTSKNLSTTHYRWISFILTVGLLLNGCVSVIQPVTTSVPVISCGTDDKACFLLGKKQFEEYRQEKLEKITLKSDGFRHPSAPTAHLNSTRTEYAVLLIHGLNDSAYYMADIANLLKGYGFNVLTVLLPGHGTDTKDMLDVTAEQWRSEVERGLAMASLFGRKIIVGGFSLGGALAIDATLKHTDVHGLLLFSPAIKFRSYNGISGLTCLPGLRNIFIETALPLNPVKYTYRAGNGVCQLSRVIKTNLANKEDWLNKSTTFMEKLRKMGQRLKVPTFIALTYADARISPQAILEWADQIDAPVTIATFGTAETDTVSTISKNTIIHISDENLPHSFLVRRNNQYNAQENPKFDAMAVSIEQFLEQYF